MATLAQPKHLRKQTQNPSQFSHRITKGMEESKYLGRRVNRRISPFYAFSNLLRSGSLDSYTKTKKTKVNRALNDKSEAKRKKRSNTFLDPVKDQLKRLTKVVGEVLLIEELFIIILSPPPLKIARTQKIEIRVKHG